MSSTGKKSLPEKVENYLNQYEIPPDAGILTAFSGGPDSTALLSVLAELVPHRISRLNVLYIDHGLRPGNELKREHKLVRSTADKLNLTVMIRSVSPGLIKKYAGQTGCGVEASARRFRYRILRRVARRYGCGYIATGHNRNDQIETVLVRFLQGSGPGGLSGIPAKRGMIIRPLIEVTKDEIFTYLAERELGFSTDSTNLEKLYQRNRVRADLIPVIKRIFPGFETSLIELAEKQGRIEAWISGTAESTIRWESCDGGERISADTMENAPAPVKEQALYTIYNRKMEQTASPRIPYRFIRALSESIVSGEPEGIIGRGYGLVFEKMNTFIYIHSDVALRDKRGYCVLIDKDTDRIQEFCGFQIKKTLLSLHNKPDPWIFDIEEDYPFLVRSWRTGDTIKINEGRKEIKKLFQEWGVNSRNSWKIPVVETKNGIAAVLGGIYGFPNRYANNNQYARLSSDDRKIIVFLHNNNGVMSESTEQ